MVNYSNGIIYKICCVDTDIKQMYIGSTTNFNRRRTQHKSVYINVNDKGYNYNVYQFIRLNGGWDNWSMIQLEAYEATDKRNLETRERYYIDLLNPSLNKVIPTRTTQEYRDENKDKIQIYRNENKVAIAETTKIYCEKNKVKIAKMRKAYKTKNKSDIKIYQTKYDLDNRDAKNEKTRIRYHLKFYNKLENFILS
jgi:hypothetical protein